MRVVRSYIIDAFPHAVVRMPRDAKILRVAGSARHGKSARVWAEVVREDITEERHFYLIEDGEEIPLVANIYIGHCTAFGCRMNVYASEHPIRAFLTR